MAGAACRDLVTRPARPISTAILIAGSAVTLGRLLAGAAPLPLPLLKTGVIAMAVVDAWLVFSDRLQAPNAILIAASAGIGLRQLQSASLGTTGLGCGDFFAAAVLGGILAAERAYSSWPPSEWSSCRCAETGSSSSTTSGDDPAGCRTCR